jgi:5-methylcytosine-specific restriction endonuclease McrA
VPARYTSARRREQRAAAGTPWHGGNWIRKEKRLRIYARDDWRCVWCLSRVTLAKCLGRPGVRLATLDHLVTRERGGGNDASNLLTACVECNQARGNMSAVEFAFSEGGTKYIATPVLNRVIEAIAKPLPARDVA